MPNESLYFEMYQYERILVNCLRLIQKWSPETMTLSVFVESAGIDGKFPDFRKEGGAYTYGSRLVRVDEITDKDVAMFTLLSVKSTIIFTFAVSDLWDKPPCVTFQSYKPNRNIPLPPEQKLGRGIHKITLKASDDGKKYIVLMALDKTDSETNKDSGWGSKISADEPAPASCPPTPSAVPRNPNDSNSAFESAPNLSPEHQRGNTSALASKQAKVGQKQEEVNAKNEDANALLAKFQELCEKVRLLDEKLQAENKKCAEERRRLEERKNAIKDTENKIETLKNEIENRNRESVELEEKYKCLEAESQKDYSGYKEWKDELDGRYGEILKIYDYYSKENKKPAQMEALIEAVKNNLDEMEDQIRQFYREREKEERLPNE